MIVSIFRSPSFFFSLCYELSRVDTGVSSELQDMFIKVDELYLLLSLYFLSLGLPNMAWDMLLLKIICRLSEIQTQQCIPYFYLANLATQLLFQEVFYMWIHLSSPCRTT